MVKLIILCLFLSFVSALNEFLETLSVANGFTTETHQFTSLDGYISQIYRISGRKDDSRHKKPAVMFINGLFGGSNFWLANEPHLAPPFILASRGYDVWLTNSRGSHFA